jgi:hypothetical protein
MRTSFRGNDRGSALVISVALILILSFLFLTAVPYIISMGNNAEIYKGRIVNKIVEDNREIMRNYDVH